MLRIMKTLIVTPDSNEKLEAIVAFMKALKISFVENKSSYDPEFVEKIKKGDEDIDAGRTKRISLDDIWK